MTIRSTLGENTEPGSFGMSSQLEEATAQSSNFGPVRRQESATAEHAPSASGSHYAAHHDPTAVMSSAQIGGGNWGGGGGSLAATGGKLKGYEANAAAGRADSGYQGGGGGGGGGRGGGVGDKVRTAGQIAKYGPSVLAAGKKLFDMAKGGGSAAPAGGFATPNIGILPAAADLAESQGHKERKTEMENKIRKEHPKDAYSKYLDDRDAGRDTHGYDPGGVGIPAWLNPFD